MARLDGGDQLGDAVNRQRWIDDEDVGHVAGIDDWCEVALRVIGQALELRGPVAREFTCPSISVYPSGADVATTTAAIVPVAPGRFATMVGTPKCSDRPCASTRATRSVPPPGGNPTRILTVPVGYAEPACAGNTVATQSKAMIALAKILFIGCVSALPSSAPSSVGRGGSPTTGL